jgi:uncharacterized membrane protein YkoI
MRSRFVRIGLAAALALVAPASASRGDGDHERAYEALRRGEIVSLRSILDAVQRDFEGRVVEVELERDAQGAWIYEIELVAEDGSILRLVYEAARGRLVSANGRGLERARRAVE